MTQAKSPMTPEAIARIHSSEAKQNGGSVAKGSFTARAQRSVAKKTNTGKK